MNLQTSFFQQMYSLVKRNTFTRMNLMNSFNIISPLSMPNILVFLSKMQMNYIGNKLSLCILNFANELPKCIFLKFRRKPKLQTLWNCLSRLASSSPSIHALKCFPSFYSTPVTFNEFATGSTYLMNFSFM